MARGRKSRTTRTETYLTDAEYAYLTDGEVGPPSGDFEHYDLTALRMGKHGIKARDPRELIDRYGDEFLKKFIEQYPCKRPYWFYQFIVPRQPDRGTGIFYEGTLPEPRKRLGGSGEFHKDYVPSYRWGMPHHYHWSTFDANDPPLFESQAEYLERWNLLTQQEKKWLKEHPEAREPEAYIMSENDKREREVFGD
jgi:hypothetical protein